LILCGLLFAVSVLLRGENVMSAFLFAVALAVAVKSMAKKTDYKSVLRRAMRFGEGAY